MKEGKIIKNFVILKAFDREKCLILQLTKARYTGTYIESLSIGMM